MVGRPEPAPETGPDLALRAVRVPIDRLLSLPPRDLPVALALLGRPLAADRDGPWLTRRHVALARRVLGEGGAIDLPRGLRIRAAAGWFVLSRRDGPARSTPPPAAAPPDPAVPALRRVDLDRGRLDLAALRRASDPRRAALDRDVIGDTPEVRSVLPTDRFRPLGGPQREPVRVLVWLKKQGIPRSARAASAVLVGVRGVAWVVGRRVDRDHAVGAVTRRVSIYEVARCGASDAVRVSGEPSAV